MIVKASHGSATLFSRLSDSGKTIKQRTTMFFEKRWKSRILGVDRLSTQAYKPPPLLRFGNNTKVVANAASLGAD